MNAQTKTFGVALLMFAVGACSAPPQKFAGLPRDAFYRSTVQLAFTAGDQPDVYSAAVLAYANEELSGVAGARFGRGSTLSLIPTRKGLIVEALTPRELTESERVALFDDVHKAISNGEKIWTQMQRLKRPNQSPEPTAMSVTPPAAQEPRQP